jgi:hypothetical protein
VTEWFKVHAWNACVREYREFESHLLRHFIKKPCNSIDLQGFLLLVEWNSWVSCHTRRDTLADYLLIRNGTYYYQRQIPSSILQNLPSISPVLRISLKTGRKSEAKALSQKLTVMFDEFAKLYFKTLEEYAEDRMMLLRFENATCLSELTPMHINQFFEKYGDDAADKIGKVRRVIEARKSETLYSSQVPVNHSVPAVVAKSQSPLVSSLVDNFIVYQRKKSNWGQGNSSEDKYRNALKYFLNSQIKMQIY